MAGRLLAVRMGPPERDRFMSKAFTREYRFELSTVMLAVGILVTFIGSIGVFLPKLPDVLLVFQSAIKGSGNWIYWYLVVGPVLLISGGWWLYDSVRKTFELMSFLKIDSKAKFVRNLDDIEYLAWVLPRKYEELVIEKKKQFKM